MKNHEVLSVIDEMLQSRKNADAESSYVASLFAQDPCVIVQKVEHAVNALSDASKVDDKLNIVREVADLWFHSMVLLNAHDLGMNDVLMELKRRAGISGLDNIEH